MLNGGGGLIAFRWPWGQAQQDDNEKSVNVNSFIARSI
jgi:hypothetical protein